ncbi:MAG: class C sortase, partial [Bifidobacterium adolescentis]
ADGSYSLTRTLTANLSVRLMFSANTVVYNVNGGDPYDSDNPETGHEIYIKRGSSYTNKTAATKRNDDGWRFTDWKYDDDHILGVNHKITYGSKTNDLSISQNDQTVVSGIPAEKGITLTAQWTYRQAFATTPEEDAEYTSFLNEDPNGVMAYINIPRLKSTLPIYHYTTPESLQKGVGHLRGSALPVGGKNTHAVLSAHRGLPTSRLFTDLDKVRKGDHFYITVLNRTLAYEVDRISVVKPDQTKELSVQPGKDLVTLVTCTPYGVNTQRLLVRGHRVPYNAAQAKHEAADSAVSSFTVYGFVATYGTLAIALAGIAVLRRNAAARTPHHAADWPHSLTVSVR